MFGINVVLLGTDLHISRYLKQGFGRSVAMVSPASKDPDLAMHYHVSSTLGR